MHEIVNKTPFSAEGVILQDKNGEKQWIVAVKATYNILDDGTTEIAEEQKPVTTAPVYLDEPGTSSLLYDTDFVLSKKTTDVILNGSAHAPKGKTKSSLKVKLKVANINKTLLVKGTRRWIGFLFIVFKGLMKPFSKMPITYENTYGGTDPDNEKRLHKKNPVGTGYLTWPWKLKGQNVPNIYSGSFVSRLLGNKSVGFGPVASNWHPRLKFGGTYDEKWEKTKKPLLADDFKDEFFQCAPKDQQTKSFLTGGEPVELTNLSPEGKLSFEIPKISLNLKTVFDDKDDEISPLLHTVIIEPDDKTVSTVWHISVPCQNRDEILRKTEIRLSDSL
ncbi:MAG: DUF2169 domain-containing protein [Desulfobacterales bacterium]|nr:DUF2169 domain-containing protein [Desulfobacterales bacterium]MCP4162689.1 DUF2169 domain-containing protein [Deltaproteobacteria bacterium]